jgi:hypothetical protein
MMAGANQFTAKQFTDAIPGTGGIIAAIAKRVGCDWHTAKRYIDTLPTVRQAYEDECSGIDDLAESTVIRAIKEGDVGSAKWWLEKRRRDKFADRQEIVVSGGDAAIPITLVDYRAGITEA